MMHKESTTAKVLEYLAGAAGTSADLFVAIVEAGHGASQWQIERKLEEVRDRRLHKSEALKKRRRSFYAALYRLRRDGLIESRASKWRLTNRGQRRLSAREAYTKEPDDTLKIVIFDVPENMRRDRDWLRGKLGTVGFKMLQKSVWAGKAKISQRLLDEMRKRELLDHVEIFVVSKTGSLESIK